MLQDEVRNLLDKIEKELLEFVIFVRNLEGKCNKDFPDSERKIKTHDVNKRKDISQSNSTEDDNVVVGCAIVDSFNIVKCVLLRISNLIDEFASLPTEDERNAQSTDSYLITFYYSQYVYQVASYLVKMVEEHLGKFSERLNYLASPKTDAKVGSFPASQKREMPSHFNVEQSKPQVSTYSQGKSKPKVATYFNVEPPKPETPSHQEDSIYKHSQSRDYKNRLKTVPEDLEFHTDSLEEVSDEYISSLDSDENIRYSSSEEDDGTQVILIHLRNLVKELVTIVEELLLHIKCDKRKRKAYPSETGKAGPCCAESCEKCCVSCKDNHKYKTFRKYREELFEWDPSMLPNVRSIEPFWMRINPGAEKDCTSTPDCTEKLRVHKKKNEISSQTHDTITTKTEALENEIQAVKDHGTQYPSEIKIPNKYYASKSGHNRLYNLQLQGKLSRLLQNKTVERIKPGKHTRQLSSGELSSKTRRSPKKHTRPKRKLPASLYKKMKQLPPGLASFVEKELPDRKTSSTKEYLRSERDLDTLQNQYEPKVSTSNSTELDTLTDKTQEENLKYPHAVVFNLHMFSNMLEQQFRNHFSRSSETTENSERILDIVSDCITQSLHYHTKEESIKDENGIDKYEKPEKFEKITETEKEYNKERVKDLDAFVNEIILTATQIARDVDKATDDKSPFDKAVFQQAKCRKASRACESCMKMVQTYPSCSEEDIKTSFDKERYFRRNCMKGCCFHCGNARERGLTIHQCHDHLPTGLIEIRHMDDNGKICVCYLKWDMKKETDDWRWNKSPFYDPTRVEVTQESTFDKDTFLRVFYGREGNMVKESFAETELKIVNDCQNPWRLSTRKNLPLNKYVKKSASVSWMDLLKGSTEATKKRIKSLEKTTMDSLDKIFLTKLGRFFDELHHVGYGKGPPLVIKLQRRSALNDAHNLLMVPSKIRLNYYRNLRIIFTEKEHMEPTTTNFIDEDESDEIFSFFARKLFSPSDMRLFEYPSQETQYLYPNPETKIHHQWFEFAGVVLGLAIIHEKQLDVNLAACLFKCLLDRPLHIGDLKEIDPLFYQRLMWMKENEIMNLKGKMTTFTVKDNTDGNVYEKELITDGSKIVVTDKNKYRYIDLAVKWKLAERCLQQLKALRVGFVSVLDPCFLSMFSEKELQSLIKHPPNVESILSESTLKKSSKEISRRETW